FYVSSQQGALVGGDIYEVVDTPYGARVLIGDVQGKGLRTLGAGAAVLTAFREAAYHLRSLSDGVDAMEVGLRRYNSSHTRERNGSEEERFVTALVFGVERDDPAPVPGSPADTRPADTRPDAAPDGSDSGDTALMVLIDCGHVKPYLLHADGTVDELDSAEPGLPLGLGDLTGAKRSVQRIPIEPDTRVLACTDGVTEARCPTGEFYPLADRLSGWASLPTPELLG
ncbi:PP2C family protein-serine/threonine phosphatase, partial [Streptomyces sp. 2MCAF27]